MSLYDDEVLDSNKDGSGKGLLIIIIYLSMSKLFFLLIGGWSGSIKLLQGSIHAKKFHQQQQSKVKSDLFLEIYSIIKILERFTEKCCGTGG